MNRAFHFQLIPYLVTLLVLATAGAVQAGECDVGEDSPSCNTPMATLALPSLTGSEVTLQFNGSSAGTATVGDGVEFVGLPMDDRFSIDVGANSIAMFNNTTNSNVSITSPAVITVGGLDFTPAALLMDVVVTVEGGAALDASDITFTESSVRIDAGGSYWPPGSAVEIQLVPLSGGLLGDTVRLYLYGSSNESAAATVGAGVEFAPLPGDSRFSMDVGVDSLQMYNSSSANVLFSAPQVYILRDLDWNPARDVVGLIVNSAGISGLARNRITFDDQTVRIDVTGSLWMAGAWLDIQLVTDTDERIFVGSFE